MKRIIAVNSNCYHGYSIEEAIEGIRAAGFHYIELTATKGWTEHVFPNQSFSRLLQVQDELKQAELIPFAMSGHTNLMDPQRLPDFIQNIRLAHFFGCDYIVSSIGEAHLEDRATATDEIAAQQIQTLVPYLEQMDMKLVLELHGEHATGVRMQKLVQMVGSDRVGINYDTANAIYYGGVSVPEDFAKCIDQVQYLHLKEKAGGEKEWNFPALGKGYVDFPAVFAQLEEKHNNSPFSVEIEFTQAGPKDLQEINQAVRDSADYLRAQGFEL